MKVDEAVEHIRRQRLSLKSALLKGSDRTVLQAAKALHLNVAIRPILSTPDARGEEDYFIGDVFKFDHAMLMDGGFQCEESPWKNYLTGKGIDDASHINWCQKSSSIWQAAVAAHIIAGNEYAPEICYQAAAILVSVPSWGERNKYYFATAPCYT